MSVRAHDDLLQPTLENPDRGDLPKPWYPKSLYYLAFFGGGFAASLVSFENARRLQMKPSPRWLILGLGVAFVIGATVGTRLWIGDAGPGEAGDSRQVRLVLRVLSVALAWLLIRIQRPADALYQVQTTADEVYGSMWVPGLLAAVVGFAVHFGLLTLVLSWTG